MKCLGLAALLMTLLVLPDVGPVFARTADPKPWHVLKPVKCCFDNNTGTAAFVDSYVTKEECLAAALNLASGENRTEESEPNGGRPGKNAGLMGSIRRILSTRKQTPANCHSAACASEVWCINVDESGVNGLQQSR